MSSSTTSTGAPASFGDHHQAHSHYLWECGIRVSRRQWSLAFLGSPAFPGLSQLCHTNFLRVPLWQPTLVFSLSSDPQSLSLGTQTPLALGVSMWEVSWLESAVRQWPLGWIFSVLPLEHLLHSSLEFRGSLLNTPMRRSPSVRKLFLLHNSLPDMQVPILKTYVYLFVFIFFTTTFWLAIR